MLLFINETIQFPDGKGYLPTLPQLLHECGDIQYLCYASYLFATFVQDRKTFFIQKREEYVWVNVTLSVSLQHKAYENEI